jgi:hypothetical protein
MNKYLHTPEMKSCWSPPLPYSRSREKIKRKRKNPGEKKKKRIGREGER